MNQAQLGKNGPLVSTIGLGCMSMSIGYGPGNEAESIKTIHRALDLGVTFIDTADGYGWGHNESLIAKALQSHPAKITLATKFGFAKRGGEEALDYYLDGSPKHVKIACEASLNRLKVETIDLYYLHRVDPNTPIEDTIAAMAELVKEGKIRYIGLSEVKPSTIRRAAAIHPITAVQTEYSLWERKPESEIIPTCEELGIGFVAYSPLGRGFLAGSVVDLADLVEDDFRRILPRFQGENFVANKKLLRSVQNLADKHNCSMAQIALAWILAKNVIPIPGAKRVLHLEENVGATEIFLSTEDVRLLDDAFPVGCALGEKYPEEFEREG